MATRLWYASEAHPSSATSSQYGPAAARRLAELMLAPLRDRWQHTVSVATRASELAGTVAPGDRDILVAAAWLHDIGYAPSIEDSGFHPLDGARLLARQGWPDRICALVAHHSGARFTARAAGQAEELSRFGFERTPVSDALTYADQTVGSYGQRLPIEERLADMLRRHGPDSAQALAHSARAPYLRATARRVQRRIWTGPDADSWTAPRVLVR